MRKQTGIISSAEKNHSYRMGGAGVSITRTSSIKFQEFVMTEQNNELAIAAFKKGDFALPCENADELYHLRYLKDTYSLLSQLIIEGYDFKPDSLDNPVILRKFPDFIPKKLHEYPPCGKPWNAMGITVPTRSARHKSCCRQSSRYSPPCNGGHSGILAAVTPRPKT